jgi:UDP-N-acetylglucosamine/UDP-N-acetylgalactosamine diphosphorylase
VQLKGGFFEKATFLKGASFGSGAHVRNGTILEEHASCAHTVGLKQTILFPYVTLGSLINFCDCFMAGGTGPKNHSEVGSSYIHFNFSANQDKATASLLGDVPHGVMLDQPPIFLGGQGGLVGPCRVNFGNVIAAGSICRKDVEETGKLILESKGSRGSLAFNPSIYTNLKRLIMNNTIYLANILALRQWYLHVRPVFIGPQLPEPLCDSLRRQVDRVITERIQRFEQLIEKAKFSLEALNVHSSGMTPLVETHQMLISEQQALIETFDQSCKADFTGDKTAFQLFYDALNKQPVHDQTNYIGTIQTLDATTKAYGIRWLNSIVKEVTTAVTQIIPKVFS